MRKEIDIWELGRKIKKHDKEAFCTIYREYFPNLQHYAMRYLYDWDEAENLVQHAFFTLWTNLNKYDERYSIVAYLLTIVKNNCLKYIRSLKIQDNHQEKMVEALLFANMAEEETDEDLHRRLQEVLSYLPEKQKEVLLKHVVEHKTMPDIARELNIAESTAKTHYKRAIAYLREHLHFILWAF